MTVFKIPKAQIVNADTLIKDLEEMCASIEFTDSELILVPKDGSLAAIGYALTDKGIYYQLDFKNTIL